MATTLWGHRPTEDDNKQLSEDTQKVILNAAANPIFDDEPAAPKKNPADEIADFNENMEVGAVGDGGDIPEVELPDVEIPEDAKDETPSMGAGEHARLAIRQETGKRADQILTGDKDLYSRTMRLFGVSKEGSAAALIHAAPFVKQLSNAEASREEKALERLRTGDYDDKELEEIVEAAGTGLKYDYGEIGKQAMLSHDPNGMKRKLLAEAAESELIRRTGTRQEAGKELDRRERTVWGKITGSTLENSGYVNSFIYGSSIAGGLGLTMTAAEGSGAAAKIGVAAVNSMVSSVPTSAVGGMERYQRLSKKDYELGADGSLQVIDNNYGELRSMVQGGVGGFVENTVVEGLTDTAVELACLGLSKIPGANAFIVKPLQKLGNAAVKKMMGSKAGRALLHVGKAYNGISQFTHFESQPVEMLEENLQPIFDDVFGLDKKRGEHKGFGAEAKAYWDNTLTLANQKEIFYGLVGTCLLQAGVGGAGSAWAKHKRGGTSAKEATSVLTDYANVPKEKVAALSDEEKIALCDLYRTMSANPEKMMEFAERLGTKSEAIMEDIVNRAGAKMNSRLEAEGMSPSSFVIPTREENGKQVPDFQFTIGMDMVTGKQIRGRMVTDAESGVMIRDNGSGVGTERAYTVIDPNSKREVDVPNLMLARKTASLFKNTAKMTRADRMAKQEYINNVWQQKYGNVNVEQYDTIDDAVAASAQHGVDVAAQPGFTPDRAAWHLKDGTIVFVRDNINSPYEVDTLFQHEIIGHNEEAMQDEFMANLDSKEIRKAQEALGLTDEQMADPVVQREVFANVIQARRHNPSIMQKLKHFINEKRRAAGEKRGISDADLEVLAQKWEKSAMGDAGNMKSVDAPAMGGMEFRSEDGGTVNNETEQEETDETRTGADETPAQAQQGVEQPGEPEAPRPAEGAAQDGEAAGAVTDEGTKQGTKLGTKPVPERTVIEKMTEEAPVQELNTDEVFNDDSRIPNFKEGANPETGEVEPLQGEPYDLVSNPIVVMEFNDGKKVVVTGRHRLALYKRSGREKIAARVIREADGWTVKDAKMIDAIGNIIDEKGSVKDYVKYYEDARPSRDAAEAGGFLARPKGKLAFGIYEGATEDTRSAIDFEGSGADGMISVEQAGIIAEAAPKNGHPRNKALQRILVAKALNGLRGKKLGILARSLAEEVKHQKNTGDTGDAMQLDLFSSPEDQALLAMEDKRADYRTRKSQDYARVAEVLRTAMAKGGKLDLNEDYARELGITDPKDKKQLAAARDKAVERANYWENAVRLDDADRTAMDAEIGASSKKTEAKKTAIADRLKAIKEGKPAPKAETPPAETPKNAPVSAPAETATTTPPKAVGAPQGGESSQTATQAKPSRRKVSAKTETKPPAAETKQAQTETKTPAPEIKTPVSGTETPVLGTETPKTGTRTAKSAVVLKDAKRAEKAKAQADDLMSLFATPELDARQSASTGEKERKFTSWARKWRLDPAKEKVQREWARKNGVMFASPEFDPEKFQKRVGAMAKLVTTLNEEGYNNFKALTDYLSGNFPKEKFDAAKPYLRGVWNALAEQMGLEEVSKKDADAIYSDIEKSYNTPPAEGEENESGLGQPREPNDGQHQTSDGESSEGNHSPAQSEGTGENGSETRESGDGTAVHDGGDGSRQGHSVERPEMADGALSAGGTENVGNDAAGSETVASNDGRDAQAGGRGAQGSESGVQLGAGLPADVGTGGSGSVAAPVRETLSEELPNAVKNENYIITDADERAIEGSSPREKIKANLDAIRVLRRLAEDGRAATPEEKQKLARFVGWGGLRPAFNNTYHNAYEREQSEGTLPPQTWAAIRKTQFGEEGYDLYKQMRELLSNDEILSLENSATSAFFTPIRLCRSIHRALAAAGLKGGRFLETSAGVGNFIGTGEYSNARWTAVELDKVTGEILKALYPKASVRVTGFEDVQMPDNFMDAIISNVPFGTEHPFDPDYKKYGFVVHDFFFAKAVDKLHPGGVAALITAPGTLDKHDKKLIRYLSERGGKIVGAVRIPNGFFSKNAGTDVATDVVFIQKVEGTADNGEFLKTGEYKGCPVSQYFLDHPEQCMGRMVPGTNQFNRPELSYRSTSKDYAEIDAAVQKAAEGLEYKSVNELERPAPTVFNEGASNGLANGNIGVIRHDGADRIVRMINGELQEVPRSEIPGLTKPLLKKLVTPQKIVRGIESLRNAFRALVDAQLANCTDEELKKLQGALNYEYSTFTSRYGALHSPLMEKFIRLDYAAAPLLLGMENVTTIEDGVDSKGNARKRKEYSKADIFTKRTIFAQPKATHADTVIDGLRISLNETGTVDTARISELTGKDEESVRKELLDTGLVFVNPETSGIETRDEYLSGSVRRKLKAANAAAEIDESFKKNVEELEKVQPDDVAATDISYQLGQNWIPRDIYEQFFREAIYQNTAPRLTVSYDTLRRLWIVDAKGHGQTEYDEESGLAIEDLLERTMNGKSIVVKSRGPDGETIVDQEATTATKIVQEKIARSFQSWMTDDVERANRIERLYNDTMNDCVPRQYDTDVLEFYGLSKEWADRVGTKGREYQKRCIARGTFGGNLLIAHCVGAGKTFEMASICMQLRRLGIARKPMFAVPNHMLAQWNREFHEAYPGAKVLVADKKDLTKQNRRAFLSRAANGDWDCIVVAHSSFSRIAMSPEHQAEYVEAEIADLTDLLMRAETEKEKTKIRKQIQSRRDKLKTLLDPSKKDDAIFFEELGCDYLFVDEAHNFKGIDIHTHMSNVPGVTGSVSQRAQDLEMKCRYIAKMHGGDKGVVFATGTPISNSISEMYVMMRYLAPSKMDEMGVRGFDDWARQFGQVVNEWSPNPSGVGFREKARFSQFDNVPEMKRFFRSFSDIVLDSELQIKRPFMLGGKPIQHILKASDAQKAYVQLLNSRMERMQGSKIDPRIDNMLKVTTEGRLLAIDPMLIGVKDESHTRANACADEVKRIYDKSTGKTVTGRDGKTMQINGTQLIFCDSGVPKKKQFKQLVRTSDGGYALSSGYWTFKVTAPDAYGNRQLYGERTDGARITFSSVADHSVNGVEDLASVYTALEALSTRAAAVNAESKPGKGVKKAKKVDGVPVDINTWLDENSDLIGYDPRFSNPYAISEQEEEKDSSEEDETEDEQDLSEEANGDVEVDNMLRGKFNMYAELRKQLIRRGIPANEIAFIHDAETMSQKQALFDKVKRGEIRILIGNTAKMGEGTNVQDRLVAIHHLDIPWKPAWMTQRDGRGIRSGNLNDEIGIHTYITEGTFDVYSWDTVGRKAKFIENAMNSRMDQRVIEDVDTTVMSLEEGKAAAAGDPRILERVKLIKDMEKEQMAFDTQVKSFDRSQMKLRVAQNELQKVEKLVSTARATIDRFNAAKGDSPFTLMTVEDEPKALTNNEELTRYIQDRLGYFARKGSSTGMVGQLFGFDVLYERGEGLDRGAYMTIKELGIRFPVTVLPGTGAAFPPADLSKFKSDITRATGKKAIEYMDSQIEGYRKRVSVAEKGVENAAGFDRTAAEDKLGEMNRRLAHLNKALGINDQTIRDIAAAYLREQRARNQENVAAAIAAAAPVESNSLEAGVPIEARLRVAEQQMAEAEFATPELDPTAKRLGITKQDLEQQSRNLGRVPWRPRKKTWAEVYQRSEAALAQTGFIEELVADAAKYARPLSAEHTIAVGQHILALGKQYEEIRTLRLDAEHSLLEAQRDGASTDELAAIEEQLKEVKKEESAISKRYAVAYKAMRMSKAEQGRGLAANKAQFSEAFDFLGMKESRQSVLGRDLTPEEMRQLHDICDRAKDLDEDARAELWAAVHAQAERTIKDLFMKDSVKRSGESRKSKLVDYRKKYLDAMAHLKIYRDTVGGSLIGITGDEYGTWNRPLFDMLLWHRFQNPDITAAEALQKVTEDVNTYITADETTVARILTGFERSWDINRHDEVLKGGRDLRSQILTDLQIGKLLNKEMPGKTGPMPGEPSEELREKRHTRDVLKSELEDETNDPRKLQSRQKRWMKWYDHRIEDLKREIAAGERLPQTKRTLAWTEEMKQKRAEYEELVKERDRVCGKSGLSEEERIKRYEAQLERTLRRATERLLAARNDDFRKPERPAAVTSAYIEELQKAIEETHREWLQEKKDRLMFGRTQAEINKFNDQREKTRERRVAYWQALTAPNADRSVVKKPQIPMSAEQQARYDELGQQMKKLRRQVMDMRAHDELMKKPWAIRNGIEYFRFVNGLTRGFLATADHSAVLRQMAQLSLGHPKLAAQVFKNTIGTAFSDEKAKEINAELLSDPRIKEAVDKGWLNWRNIEAEGNSGDVEMFSSMHSAAITIGRNADGTEKRFALDDIKGVGSVLRGSERIYASYINALSAEIYLALTNADSFTARLMFGQNGLTDFTKKEIAARINMANGSAQIDSGKKKQLMNSLTGIFWAPKLALSRLQLAVGWDIIHPLLDSTVDVKTRLRTAGFNAIEHARAKLAMIAIGTLMLMLSGDDDDKEKMRRASWFKKFLQVIKPRVGNTTLDFSGGEVGWYQLMAKWATLQKETGTGKTVYLAAKDGHKQSFGADIVNETFRFAQGKFNPLLSNAIALWTGKDYVGQPFGLGDLAINTFVPLGVADTAKAFTENGLGRGLLLVPFITFGAGGNTYPLKRYDIAVNQFTEVAKELDAVRDSKDIDEDEKTELVTELERDFPELAQRGRIEAKVKTVKYFESEIRKFQKRGVAVPPSLTDGLERAKNETLELIREARKPVDNGR